ncbi:MAG: sulfite exporter TauE/SafE family protein [Candidatus Cloacimonadaceae bacterium]
MLWATLSEGFLLGLSTGTVCLLTCAPIYLPYLISEDRSLKNGFYKVLEISAGRFFAYLFFGALAGWLGSFLPQKERTLFTGISYILLSIFLILNALRTSRAEKQCHVPKSVKFTNSAFLLGIITGVNFCPSFLIALTKAIDLGGAFSGIMLFFGFFIGTTLFLLPLAFGSLLTFLPRVKQIARWISVLIAVLFIWQGGVNLHKSWQETKAIIVNPASGQFTAYIMTLPQDSLYANALADSLATVYFERPKVLKYTELQTGQMYFNPACTIVFITAPLWKESYTKDLDRYNYVIIPVGYSIPQAVNFLQTYSFKVNKKQGFHWTFQPAKTP